MSLFGSKTKKKTEEKDPVSSGGAGYSWKPSMDDKSGQREKGNQSMLKEMHEQQGLTMIPRRRDLENVLGKAKEDSFGGLKKNSTTYRPVLDHLDALNNYLNSTELAPDPDGMNKQLDQVIALMGNLEQAVLNYIKVKENNKKAKYMRDILLPVIRNVRVTVIAKVNQYKVNPPIMMPKWYLIATGSLTKGVKLDDSMSTNASDSGALNKVDFFRLNYSAQAVFKEDKSEIPDPDKIQDPQAKQAAETEAWMLDRGRINKKDPHLANRNVAMYRLDRLLGGDLIPRTEFAIRRFGSESVQGTIMYKAEGEAAGKLGKAGKFVRDASQKTGEKQNAINVQDPVLQRCLSRLQLLDSLALQIDRHTGNYFIEYDENGKVIGVKGIDNDLSFGERTDFKSVENYPGVSKFVDKEMAERIMALRPEDLQAALGDLLSQKEMNALLQRLAKLQQHLQSAKLLEPDEWNEMTAKALMEEKTSYYHELAKDVE